MRASSESSTDPIQSEQIENQINLLLQTNTRLMNQIYVLSDSMTVLVQTKENNSIERMEHIVIQIKVMRDQVNENIKTINLMRVQNSAPVTPPGFSPSNAHLIDIPTNIPYFRCPDITLNSINDPHEFLKQFQRSLVSGQVPERLYFTLLVSHVNSILADSLEKVFPFGTLSWQECRAEFLRLSNAKDFRQQAFEEFRQNESIESWNNMFMSLCFDSGCKDKDIISRAIYIGQLLMELKLQLDGKKNTPVVQLVDDVDDSQLLKSSFSSDATAKTQKTSIKPKSNSRILLPNHAADGVCWYHCNVMATNNSHTTGECNVLQRCLSENRPLPTKPLSRRVLNRANRQLQRAAAV